MIEPNIPEREYERLSELYDFDILDSETEKDFDEIVQLAALICKSPISLMSLIDRDRQWFKAKVGMEERESARSVAFCAHAIEQDGLMEIPDATKDIRFHDNPLVTEAPNIRFYAGVPLVTASGNKMGTLCVIDRHPRQLTDEQKFALEILAKQLVRQMEFRKLSAKLKLSNERNSIFVQQSPNALAMFDREMRYMAASQKWLEDYKLVNRDIIGLSHYEIFPEIGEEWKKIHQACLAGAVNRRAEARFERADGSEQWITWDVRPWYVSDGNIGGLLMYTADISAMKQKEEENNRIRSILDKTNEVARIGTWEIDCERKALSWSRITREIHEVDASRVPDPDSAILFFKKGPSRDTYNHMYHQALLFGTSYDLELELVTAKGNEVWVRIIGQTEFDKGKCKRIYGVFHDITDRKKAELATLEARNLAEQSSKLKENFLANMSHEIRTPMNAIIGFTDLLLHKQLDPEAAEYIRIVHNSGESLLRIINDILDISKINSGMMSFEACALSIRDLFYSLNAMLQRSAEEKKLTLTFSVDDDVPSQLLGDPTRLNQILLNLTGNALKFTERGSVSVRASLLRNDQETALVHITVTDTGIGIAPDKLPFIFERFGQAEGHTTRRYGGTGLGLSIAKQLVELQDGSIAVDSIPGKGTTLAFSLPFKKISVPGPARATKKETAPRLLKGLRLLFVDDNLINLKLLVGLFAGHEVTVYTATDGRKAIELLLQETIDLVVLDVEMPEMNGYETIHHIRHVLGSQVPVIAMTANAMSGEREKCLKMGMDDYLPKPVKSEELLEKITQLLPVSPANNRVVQLDFLRSSMGGRSDLMLEVLNLFVELVPEEMEALGSAVSAGNFSVIRKRAHKLLSTVLAMGAAKMQAVLKEMEVLATQSLDLARICELYQQLTLLYRIAVEEVNYEKNLLVKNHA